MTKAPDAFRTISEAADQLDLPQHVLRHWEDVFGTIRPMRRAGGRRYYRTYDIELLSGVKTLLYDERYTTKGVQKIFKENGAQYVAEIGRRALAGETLDMANLAADAPGDKSQSPVSQNAPLQMVKAEAHASAEISHENAALKEELQQLLARLETVQDNLDEALLAIDTIMAIDDTPQG